MMTLQEMPTDRTICLGNYQMRVYHADTREGAAALARTLGPTTIDEQRLIIVSAKDDRMMPSRIVMHQCVMESVIQFFQVQKMEVKDEDGKLYLDLVKNGDPE